MEKSAMYGGCDWTEVIRFKIENRGRQATLADRHPQLNFFVGGIPGEKDREPIWGQAGLWRGRGKCGC